MYKIMCVVLCAKASTDFTTDTEAPGRDEDTKRNNIIITAGSHFLAKSTTQFYQITEGVSEKSGNDKKRQGYRYIFPSRLYFTYFL